MELLLPPLEPPLLLPPPPELPPEPPVVAGALGVNVAEGLEIHEEAAALAADADDGAALLTVALPLKLHDCGLRLLISKYWLITKESLTADWRKKSVTGNGERKGVAGLTRVATRETAVSARRAISTNVVAVTSLLTKETAGRANEFTSDGAVVGCLRSETATKSTLQATASSFIWSWRDRGGSGESIALGGARAESRGGTAASRGVGPAGLVVLSPQAVEVIARGNSIAVNCDHAELPLNTGSREV